MALHEGESLRARWSYAVANWVFGGAHVDGRWTLDVPGQAFLRNGELQPGSGLEPLDVLLFDDGLAIRAHAYPARRELALPRGRSTPPRSWCLALEPLEVRFSAAFDSPRSSTGSSDSRDASTARALAQR